MPKNILLASLLSIAGIANAAAPNLIVNGGFETASLTNGIATYNRFTQGLAGWNVIANSVDVVTANYWTAAGGNNSLDLNGTKKGAIQQSFATVAGQTYQLNFDLAGNIQTGPVIKTMLTNVGPTGTYSFDVTGKSATNMGWTHYSTTFVAVGNSTTLAFSSTTSGAGGVALDNISVAAVPEPETYAMFLAGLGLMGAVARRRRS